MAEIIMIAHSGAEVNRASAISPLQAGTTSTGILLGYLIFF